MRDLICKENANVGDKAKVRIRPYKPSDAMYLLNWLADERTVAFWKADRFSWPLTTEQLDKYQADFEADTQSCIFTALDGEGNVAGHFSFRNIDYHKNTAHLGHIVTDPAARGKGLGRQMVAAALAYAKTMLGVEKVTLGVYEQNLPAISCYEALGFTPAKRESELMNFHGESWRYFYMENLSDS